MIIKLMAFKSLDAEYAKLAAPSLFLSEKCIGNPDHVIAAIAIECCKRRKMYCFHNGQLYTMHRRQRGTTNPMDYFLRESTCRLPLRAIKEYMATILD